MDSDVIKEFISESVIMKDFHHPNVLRLLGVVLDAPDGIPHLVFPLMEKGNLKDFLKSSRVEASDIKTLPQVISIIKYVPNVIHE